VIRLLLLSASAWAGGLHAATDDEVVEFWTADFLLSDAAVPPPTSAPWHRVDLPDRWRDPERYREGVIGWYRLSLPGREQLAGEGRISAYLWRYDMVVEVWFNGVLVADTGRFEEPVTRNWNHPLLVDLPASAWHQEDNLLHVRLRAYPHYGVLAPVFVGPREALLPAWRLRSLLQNDLSEALLVLTLTIALIGFAFWFPRKRDSVYLYFALASLAYSVFSLNLVVREVPVAGETWWWLSSSAVAWYAVMLTLFGHRLIGIHRPRLERSLLGFAVAGTVTLAAVDLPTFAILSNVSHLLSLVIIGYLLVLMARWWLRTRRSDLLAFGLGMSAIFMLGLHDLSMNTVVRLGMWRDGFFLLNLGAPIVFLAMAWHLTRRYVLALADAERTNATLEVRIDDARGALEESFSQRRELERMNAAAEERERIYRDLHDDVGSRLLSLVYAADTDAVRDLARDALRELRETVSQSRASRRDLSELGEALAVEAAERAAAGGLACDTRIEIPPGIELDAVQTWHLGRIVREAVSNSLRHADAGRIGLHLALTDSEPVGAELVVEDDGRGLPLHPRGGAGLASLRHRTRELGGEIDFGRSRDGGCRISIRFPLVRAGAAAATTEVVGDAGSGQSAAPGTFSTRVSQ
jgi:signal transduction histidine kinase